MSQTQKVLSLNEKFGSFKVETAPILKPGPGELLIKVQSASLNPVDWKIQKYGIFVEKYPVVLGSDIAGDVEEVGDDVTDFKKGDKVVTQTYAFENKYSGFQQYAIAVAATTAKISDNLSYDEASTIPLVLSTAYLGLYNVHPHGLGFAPPLSPSNQGRYSGEPIIILGGSSSVGQMVIQLAKISGFSPIITTASLGHTDFLKSIGADHVFDRKLPSTELVSRVQQVTGKGVKAVYDSISSAETQQLGVDLAAPGGQVCLVLPPDASLKVDENKSLVPIFAAVSEPHNLELEKVMLHDFFSDWTASGKIKPNRVQVLPNGLTGAIEGLKRMERDEVSREKLVVRPQETSV